MAMYHKTTCPWLLSSMNKPQLQVNLVGRGPVTLRDYIASGGEGSVYKFESNVVKIFTDPDKMVQDDMTQKIEALAKIQHPWIASPLGIVTNQKHDPIGYYMPFADGESLPRFFTNDFRSQIGFDEPATLTLVDRMHEVVAFAHDKGAVIVDGNEYGWLVKYKKRQGPEPRIVDVDSWQVGRWPAKVIMPSIRDYHSKTFTPLTDWFSWGVVTFQVFTGLHPYKGTLEGYSRNDFITRMKANASVFSPNVRLNRAVRDFSTIPRPLLAWYERVFQDGERTIPPSPFDTTAPAAPKAAVLRAVTSTTTGLLIFAKIYTAPDKDPAKRIFDCGVAVLESCALINLENGLRIGQAKTPDCEVIRTPKGWLVAERVDGQVSAWYTEGRGDRVDLSLTLRASGILRFQNRIFAITDQGLTELTLQMFAKPVLGVGTSWQAMISSTKFFEGLGVQDSLGAMYLILPYNDSSLTYLRVPELDKRTIIAAKAGPRFVSLISLDHQGQYHKIELSLAKDYASYTLWETDVDSPELVIATTRRGVNATVVKDGELVVFVGANINKFADKTIATDEPLFSWGDKILLIRAGDVWHVSVKP